MQAFCAWHTTIVSLYSFPQKGSSYQFNINEFNTRDIIGFHGETVSEIIESFHAVIDEYVEDWKKRGIDPNKPYSGKFNLRLSPQLHSKIASAEEKAGKSLNQSVIDKIEAATQDI